MPDLMNLSKKKLIAALERERKISDSLGDQLSAAGIKLAAFEGEVGELKEKIDHMNYGHSQDLKADQKAITELKMQIKGDSKRFDGINMAIDTVFAIKYPGRDIYYAQYPDDEAVNLDDNFYMLQHFKRLVSLQSNTDYTGAGIRDFMQ